MTTNKINTFYTPIGNLDVEHLGHGSLRLELNGMQIYVDPYSDVCDYSKLPKADLIFITHAHTDHYDCNAIDLVSTPKTEFIVSKAVETCFNNDLPTLSLNLDNNSLQVDPSTNLVSLESAKLCLKGAPVHVLYNGDTSIIKDLEVTALPAYNIKHKRDNGHPFHIKGEGNGYLVSFGGVKVYIAGDTEFIPEMEYISNPDIAFMPKNLPYTMSDEEFLEAANSIKPKNLYPIHFFEMDAKSLAKGLSKGVCMFVDGVHYTNPTIDLEIE